MTWKNTKKLCTVRKKSGVKVSTDKNTVRQDSQGQNRL